jgi:hypothetical protein
MNIRALKERLIFSLITISIVALWTLYALLTGFNFYAFITSPVVLSIALILIVPLSFLLADVLWGSK